jgi:hypothetical protein
MPRYLRWIAACTAGITIQFAFFVAVGAVAVGTGNKTLTGFTGAAVTFGSSIVTMIGALAVNDWLRTKYPAEPKPSPIAAEHREPAEPR